MNAVTARSKTIESDGVTFCHPKWPDIRGEIETIFLVDLIRDWAIRAVIAHQHRDRAQCRQALRVIGQDATVHLWKICKGYGVDLPLLD